MNYLLTEEIKRMQRLAGVVPSKSLFEKFIDGETEYKTLKEFMNSLNEETTQGSIDAAKKYLDDLEDKGQGNIVDAGTKVANALSGIENLTRDTLGQKINTFFRDKSDQIRKTIFGATMALVILANAIGPNVSVGSKNYKVKTLDNKEVQAANQKLDQKLGKTIKFDGDKLKKASNKNKDFDDSTENGEMHVQHGTGKSNINSEDEEQLNNYMDTVASTVIDDGSDMDIIVKSGVSNDEVNNKYSNISDDGGDLTQQRNDKVTDAAKESFKNNAIKKGAKVTDTEDGFKVEKGGKTQTVKFKNQKIDYKKSKLSSPNEKETQASVIDADITSAEKDQKIDDLRFMDFVENPRLPGEIPVKPSDKDPNPDKETGGGTGTTKPIPTGDADPDEAEKIFKDKSLNRNQEIFSVLKMANPNIKGNVSDKSYKSWDDNTKKIVIDLRKSPDTLLKKFQAVTGINLSARQKSPKRFQRSGIAESILAEAAIDKKLEILGITDDAIRKNKVEIMATLMKMYNLKSSDIPDEIKKLTPDEQKQLKSITGEFDTMLKSFSDVDRIKNDLNLSTQIQTALGRINTYDEFEALILGMAALVNPNLAKQKQDIKAALFSLANKVKKMQEESETPSDTEGVYKIIETLKLLKSHLQAINTRDEFETLIFSLLGFIDPKGTITKDKNRLASAIIAASNRSSLKDPKPIDLDKLGR